jgi:hypothetical protein
MESGTQIAAQQRDTIDEIEAAVWTAIVNIQAIVDFTSLSDAAVSREVNNHAHAALAALRYIVVGDDDV